MRSVLCLVSLGMLMTVASTASAQDFRVETDVFVGDEKKPIAETLTIFSGGRVYDFLLGGASEIAIFDPGHGRFTLLDPARKLQCTIANKELLEYVLELNKAAIAQKVPLFVAAADPQFEVNAEGVGAGQAAKTKVTLASKLITYTATGKEPDQPTAADAFKQFADWYARLNAVRGGGPPGARLALNRELAERKLLPEEIVRVTIQPGLRGQKLEVRSVQSFIWALGVADRQKIEQAGDHLVNFQTVSFAEYRSAASKPAAEKTTKR
ncbi:MAG TPA: hypothetical protein VMP01_10915 [Pirellulaceae bacterium]|nr:hypothetical protein [Pirellulaceae bacterium]